MTRRTPAAPILLLTALAALVALSGCGVRDRLDPQAATGSAPAAFDTAVAAATMLGGTSIEPGVAATGDSAEHALDTVDGVRTYHLYVPASQRPTDAVAATGDAPATGDGPVAGAPPAPLLLALHGGGGTGTQFEQQSRFDELAEANGFLVAYPDGTGIGRFERGRVWNAGRCCGPAADGSDDPDDVAFLAAVIDDIASGHAVDRDRVVITGHSNGSMMALRFACERADLVAGVASQAGPLVTDGACQPSRPVPVLALHGTADANVPYAGAPARARASCATSRRPCTSPPSPPPRVVPASRWTGWSTGRRRCRCATGTAAAAVPASTWAS
ncbi:MAG: alpha/beta fold hydrolase [Acidimicrobiales bacterium]